MELIIKPNEKELETLTKVSDITGVDYDSKEWNEDITIKSLFDALEDMVCLYHKKEEELQDHKEYCEEYHVQKNITCE